MAKKRKNEELSISELMLRNDDTDPTGGKKKRNKRRLYKPYSELSFREKAQGCIVWIILIFVALVAIAPKDKLSNTSSSQVTTRATNTPRPSTPTQDNGRETSIAQSVSTMKVIQTQGAITALPTTLTNAAVSATNTPRPLNTISIPETATAQALASMVAMSMASPTPTDGVVTDSITDTPAPILIPTQAGVREIADEGIVTGESVRIRSCASTECNQMGLMNRGVTFPITGSVANGQNVSGNSLWYQIEYEGQIGYVSATLVGLVSAQNVSSPVNQSISPVQPTQPIVAPVSGWNCSGDRYNCPDFGSGGQFTCPQLFEYMSACPNDPSRLDRDQDGRFCETQCG